MLQRLMHNQVVGNNCLNMLMKKGEMIKMKVKNRILSSLLVFVVMICTVMLTACSFEDKTKKILFIVSDKVYATVETEGFETIQMPHNPTRSGYIFDGWYTDESWTELFTKEYFSNIELRKDKYIYSKWELETYTIIYENVNGASNPNPTTYTIESDNIDLVDITLDGYTFLGWYSGSFKVTQIAKGSTGDFFVTAKWEEI